MRKANHGPFLVWVTRENLEHNHIGVDPEAVVHLEDSCGYLYRGDGSRDPVPLVWSFVIDAYGSVPVCGSCLNRIKRRVRSDAR